MNRISPLAIAAPAMFVLVAKLDADQQPVSGLDKQLEKNARQTSDQVFRPDTLGDESFWADALSPHQAVLEDRRSLVREGEEGESS